MGRTIFITGGARSGKSAFALSQAEKISGSLLYVATGEARDDEMAERIKGHRRERGVRWETLEEPMALAERLPAASAGYGAVLLDCVTLWLSNLLLHHEERTVAALAEAERFLSVLPQLENPIYIVSNEVGSGIVPENRLARAFRDLAGTVNRRLATQADEAWMVVSGIPLRLK